MPVFQETTVPLVLQGTSTTTDHVTHAALDAQLVPLTPFVQSAKTDTSSVELPVLNVLLVAPHVRPQEKSASHALQDNS